MLLAAAIVALALHVLLILSTGGYSFTIYGATVKGNNVSLPLILLLILAILRFSLRYRTISRDVLSSHEAAILFSIFLIIYLANGRTLWSTDTLAARFLPLSILREGNFDLNEFLSLDPQGNLSLPGGHPVKGQAVPIYLTLVKGRYVSMYPVGGTLLALPFYLPSAIGRVSSQSLFPEQLEKVSAATLAALSAVLLNLVLRRLTSRAFALLITVVYALGTSSLSVSSQALWQHGPSQLALSAALYCVVRGRSEPRWVGLAGFPLALAVVCRPTDAIIALTLAAYVCIHHRSSVGTLMFTGFPPALFQLWYNATYFANPFRTQFPLLGSWATPLWEGLSGILLSPSRGLFVYSPILLLSVFGMARAWQRNGDPLLRYASVGVLLTILLYGKWGMWWGGSSYGPRLLADLTPSLALALYPLKDVFRRKWACQVVFVIFALWSIGAHAMGAFWDDNRWNQMFHHDADAFRQRLWLWTDNQLVNAPRDIYTRIGIVLRGLPTSRTAPELLAASYLTNLPSNLTVTAPHPIHISLEAINEGQAVWLAWAKHYKGTVRLGWRWRTREHYLPGMSGRVSLRYDVLPRQSHDFRIAIDPPRALGTYLLEVGLVSEGVAWFSDRGTPNLQITVNVDAVSGGPADDMAAREHEAVTLQEQGAGWREDHARG
jgi:hypothetical protein